MTGHFGFVFFQPCSLIPVELSLNHEITDPGETAPVYHQIIIHHIPSLSICPAKQMVDFVVLWCLLSLLLSCSLMVKAETDKEKIKQKNLERYLLFFNLTIKIKEVFKGLERSTEWAGGRVGKLGHIVINNRGKKIPKN